MSDDFITEADLEALKMESQVFGKGMGSQSSPEMAQRLLDENSVQAALSICHLAKHAADPRLRFAAAKYVVDKALAANGAAGGTAPIDAFLQKILNG